MVFSIDLTLFIYCFLLEQELFSGCCSPLGDLVPCLRDSCGAWVLLPKWHMALGAFKPHSQNSLPPPFFSRMCFFRSTPLRFLCLFLPTGSPIHCPMCVPSPAAIVLCRNTVWAALVQNLQPCSSTLWKSQLSIAPLFLFLFQSRNFYSKERCECLSLP